MAQALDDLKAAIVNLNNAVAAEIQAITNKLAGLGDSVTAADVENAVASINAATQKLTDETAKL